MTPNRVIVVDDHPDVRSVIGALLSYEERFTLVGEATNGEEGIALARSEQPDVVLLDLAMPVMDGLTALPEIQEAAPTAKVVVLSGFGTDRTVHSAMQAGASAFLHKDADLAVNLVPVLEKVTAGV
jgi:DNA-binding NarL/FixJ family response regulator